MTHFATVEASALRSAFNIAGQCVETKNTIPILNDFLITKKGSNLEIRGTDLDMEITASVDVLDAGDDWSAAVNSGALSRIFAVLGNPIVRLEIDGGDALGRHFKISVEGGPTYEIIREPAEDFPMISDINEILATPQWTNGMLPLVFKRILPYISTEDTRYYLNGVCLDILDDCSNFVATNGHFLMVYKMKDDHGIKSGHKFIIPSKAVAIISRIGGSTISTEISETKIRFKFDGVTLTTKLIDGTYPDYERVIPSDTSGGVEFTSAPALRDAALQAMAVSSMRKRALEIEFHEGAVRLKMKDPDLGSAQVDVPYTWSNVGEKFKKVGMNGEYLTKVLLKDMTGGVHICALNDHTDGSGSGPMIFNDPTEPDYLRIAMPMRI